MSLAEHVRILGRGPGRSRSLTSEEAASAMGLMLSGEAAAEAVGALLMLLRMKGETSQEIAGFAQAAQASLDEMPQADLDWPCYAAGRTRGLPWFLLSARLVACRGNRVLLHGWNGTDASVRQAVERLSIPYAQSAAEAAAALDRDRIAYMPLETMQPALFALLALRAKLGLRSCINTVCRMLNPARADASVQGVFHPPYRKLQADAGALLGLSGLTVIKGGGGEFERHPGKAIAAFGLRGGAAWEAVLPAFSPDGRRLSALDLPPEALGQLWECDTAPAFARDLVMGTARLALDTLGVSEPAEEANRLWSIRQCRKAA
ncbi:MAG: glycosyl transferase family protein [Pseudomonadota bacterium]